MVDVWSALDNLATAYTDSATVLQTDDVDVKIAAEIATFFSEALAPRTEDPLLWWKINENRLPLLAAVEHTWQHHLVVCRANAFSALLVTFTLNTEHDWLLRMLKD